VLAPFSTSPTPFHDQESYSLDVSSPTPSASRAEPPSTLPIPIPVPIPASRTNSKEELEAVAPESGPAPFVSPPAEDGEKAGLGLATPHTILAGKPLPLVPLQKSDSSLHSPTATAAVSTKTAPYRASIGDRDRDGVGGGIATYSPSAIEGGIIPATTSAALVSSSTTAANESDPAAAETSTPWSPSPKRAAARPIHPLKPIIAPSPTSSTAAAASAASVVAVAGSSIHSTSTLTSTLSSGFSHKLRRRLLDAPDIKVEDRCGTIGTIGTISSYGSGHSQIKTGSDVAAAAAAAVAASVTASSSASIGIGLGPADDIVKRPGLLRRCMSLMEDSSSAQFQQQQQQQQQQQPSVMPHNQRDKQASGNGGIRIPRSMSWDHQHQRQHPPACSNVSAVPLEPPRPIAASGGPLHHRRPSMPSPSSRNHASSRRDSRDSNSTNTNSCEVGSNMNMVGGRSPSRGMQASPALPAPASGRAPASLGLMSASPSRSSSSLCGSDGGLRISPLHRSDSVCSVSDADPEAEDDTQAASFFMSGSSLGSDGIAPHHPQSPLLCCSPPMTAPSTMAMTRTLSDVPRAYGKSKHSSGSGGGGVWGGGLPNGSRESRETRDVRTGGARNAKQHKSPVTSRGRGQSANSSIVVPNTPEGQGWQSKNAGTPAVKRQDSYFERQTPSTHQEQLSQLRSR